MEYEKIRRDTDGHDGASSAASAGCSPRKTGEEQETALQEEDIQIGLSFDSFVIERWMRDRDVFVSTAQSLGAQVNVQIANGDVEEQISQIEYFISKDMDVIVIIAIDGDALTDVVRKAKEEGIRVISYDRLIPNAGTDLYISFDNYRVGVLMGERCRRLFRRAEIFSPYTAPLRTQRGAGAAGPV